MLSKFVHIHSLGSRTTCVANLHQLLILAFPIVLFFVHDSAEIVLVLFLVSSFSLLFSIIITNWSRKIYLISFVGVLVVFDNLNSFFCLIELYYVIRYFIILNAFLAFSDIRGSLLVKATFVVIIIETALYFTSFFVPFIKFFPNDSLFAILYSTQLAFVWPLLTAKIDREKILPFRTRWMKILAVGGCCMILASSGGRAGIAGFVVSILVSNLGLISKSSSLKKMLVGSVAIISILFLLFIKFDSSKGRLLLYKVLYSEFPKDKIVSGIGYGSFKS